MEKNTFNAIVIYNPLSVLSFSRNVYVCVCLDESMCVNDHTYTKREGESGGQVQSANTFSPSL